MATSVTRAYYSLTKPGIVYGNVITAVGGFLLASGRWVDFGLLVATAVGVGLIIASACVINNYMDRDIDKKMARTAQRASVQGLVSPQHGLMFAGVLGVLGFAILAVHTNWLVVGIGLIGFVDYVIFYAQAKRRSPYGTLVGTISGATPILAGYCAVTNSIDGGALLLFLALVFWQMAHFYAIAIYRLHDYQAARIPVWPAVHGIADTKRQIVTYIIAFLATVTMLTIFGYTGVIFAIVMGLLSLQWLRMGMGQEKGQSDRLWARGMFSFSLVVILSLSFMLAIDTFLP